MVHDLDVELSDEERAIREMVHRFALEVLRPAGRELDRLDAADVIADGSVLWEVHRRWDALGVRVFAGDPASLGAAEAARLSWLVNEELGWGDAGLAVSLGVAEFPAMLARASQNPELIAEFPTGRMGCWAITEPDHGSDELDWSESPARPTLRRPNCVATRYGDEYVVSGQKAAWVSNGTIANAAALYTAVDEGDGPRGCGILLVDLEARGVSRGKPLEKLGQRPLPQGEIFFDDVRVAARNMVVAPAMYPAMLELTLCTANGFMGAAFAGLARAAYEHALAYAKERVQGGVPIFEHQSVKAKLFEMFRKVEAARALNRRVVLYNTLRSPFFGGTGLPAVEYAIASKVTSTQTAFEVASEAIQIFGGNGLSREYPVEKLLRDARASLIEDGVNEVLGLHAAAKLGAA
ncbi:MAG: acyl-CoA/acyl-ACP dehydrogenase [Deltaproteobacteria bacterium]|nr:acyl-CoA/acyl-ACP dehydrogenase [Deltaproteobacteria bacterium]